MNVLYSSRPEHLRLSRLKSLSVNEDERGFRLVVIRPPKGPEGNSKGFLHYVRRQWTGPPLNQPQMMMISAAGASSSSALSASGGMTGVVSGGGVAGGTVVTPSLSASSLLPPSSSGSYTSAAGGQSSPSPANTPPKKSGRRLFRAMNSTCLGVVVSPLALHNLFNLYSVFHA